MTKSAAGLIIMGNKLSNLASFISFIMWCIFYSCILALQDLYHSIQPVFKFLHRLLPKPQRPVSPSGPAPTFLHGVTKEDVELVMENLGLFGRDKAGALEGSLDDVGSMLTKDLEPNLGEVREAFEVFDENKDGFIDARELNKVMKSLGLDGFSQHEVEKMILAFDEDGDGRIDFEEFVKLMEDCC